MKVQPSIKFAALVSMLSGASLFLTVPGFAQDAPVSNETAQAAPVSNETAQAAGQSDTAISQTQTSTTTTAATHHEQKHEDVEARIKDLHDRLKITSAEEDAWSKVAQVMRDNASSMKSLMDSRQGQTQMTALDDLKSYQAITAAHAEGLKTLIAAFEPLYNAMSADQQKTADSVFSHRMDKKDRK